MSARDGSPWDSVGSRCDFSGLEAGAKFRRCCSRSSPDPRSPGRRGCGWPLQLVAGLWARVWLSPRFGCLAAAHLCGQCLAGGEVLLPCPFHSEDTEQREARWDHSAPKGQRGSLNTAASLQSQSAGCCGTLPNRDLSSE